MCDLKMHSRDCGSPSPKGINREEQPLAPLPSLASQKSTQDRGTGWHSHLSHNEVDEGLDSIWTDIHPQGDFFTRQPLGQELDSLALAFGQTKFLKDPSQTCSSRCGDAFYEDGASRAQSIF